MKTHDRCNGLENRRMGTRGAAKASRLGSEAAYFARECYGRIYCDPVWSHAVTTLK